MAKRRKRAVTELRFDLDSIRVVKRQLNRTLRYVTAIEKGMLKFKREENKRKAASKRDRRAAIEHGQALAVRAELGL